MFYLKYKHAIKRLIVISISLGVVFSFVLIGIVAVAFLSPQEQDIIIDYTDSKSVQSAEQQGIFSLEQGDIIVLQLSPSQYRVARLLSNESSSWSARTLEYSFLVNNQEFVETTSIPAGATQLIVVDVESQNAFTKHDVQFRINRSSWHTATKQPDEFLRAHGSVVTTKIQEDDIMRTTVAGTITNESNVPASNVSVGVLAYNNDTIVGVGDATISTLLAEQDQQVTMHIGGAVYKDITNVVFYVNGSVYSGAL